ncbi:MAG: DUF1573 domain-containing protein [Opitutales bacterium]|nr:DUF1573 domain-containing protein [Opitutales bacterium]
MSRIALWLVSVFLSGIAVCEGGLQWEKTHLSLKARPGEDILQAEYAFSVTGNPVTILRTEATCGCTTAKLAKDRYLPGETGVIEVLFDTRNRMGVQRKSVFVETDDPDSPKSELVLEVYIPQILRMDPRFVYWDKNADSWNPKTIVLNVDVEESVELESVSSDTPQLRVEVEKGKAQGEWLVHLTPVIPEGETPFFRAVITCTARVGGTRDGALKRFLGYAFMKEY